MLFLARILATITGSQREKVIHGIDFTWNTLWIHNIFRMYEVIFYRRVGIRAEMSVSSDGEHISYDAHTWEAWFALAESRFRAFFRELSLIRISIPSAVTPTGQRVLTSPYVFDIAFDNSASNSGNPLGNTSLIVTGSNTLVVAGVRSQGSTTTATYVTSMTRLGSAFNLGGTDWDHFFFNLGQSGTNNVVFTNLGTGSSWMAATSYTGAKQTSQPDASNTNSGSSTAASVSVTTVADGSWIIAWGDNEVDTLTASTNCALRKQSPSTAMGIYEYSTQPKSPAGAQTINMTMTVSGSWYVNGASFSPNSFSPTGGGGRAIPYLNLLGVGT